MDGIESLCSHLPGTPAKLCKDEVEKMFPVVITFLTTVVVSLWIMRGIRQLYECILTHIFPCHVSQKPPEICKVIGLCKGCQKQEKLLQYFTEEAFQAAELTETVSKPLEHE